MSEQDLENLDSPNETTEEVVNTDEVEVESHEEETEDIEKLREQNRRLFERTKKAEELAKQLRAKVSTAPATQTPEKQGGEISLKDQYALLQAQVPVQDVDEVIKAAKLLGKSIPDALNDGLVKARLSQLAEERTTAAATSTGAAKRVAPRVTDETLVQKAVSGNPYDMDPDALAEATMNLKKKK